MDANIESWGATVGWVQADLVCTQEFSTDTTARNLRAQALVQKHLPFEIFRTASMASYSRWPIGSYEAETFSDGGNALCWVDLEFRGRKLRCYNLHLQSYQFSRKLGLENLARFRQAQTERAVQARRVAESIRSSPYPVVVCGDFNDVPASYTYACLARGLRDGFRDCGKGLAKSYRGWAGMRSDYVLCSRELRFCRYEEIRRVDFSDHLWVLAELDWCD